MHQGKNSRRAKAAQFFNQRGPSIPPQKNYQPTRSTNKPAGYSEIEAVSKLEQDSPDVIAFVRDVVKKPPQMAAVRTAGRGSKRRLPLSSRSTRHCRCAATLANPLPGLTG